MTRASYVGIGAALGRLAVEHSTGKVIDDVDDLAIGHGITIPGAELQESFSRSGGPGGQHVNTSSSKVELRFDVEGSQALTTGQKRRLRARLAPRLTAEGVLVIHASEERSQSRNRDAARRRLARLLGDGLRPVKTRRPTRPTAAAQRRRVERKKRRSDVKKLRRPPREP